jgi:uncharacterized protein (DUF1015 family)
MVQLELPVEDPLQPALDRYALAALRFRSWIEDQTLRADPSPALYVYDVSFAVGGVTHVRRGFLGALRLEPWARRVVRPHERTLSGPKQDRFALMKACAANFSPIWCLYDHPVSGADGLRRDVSGRTPDAAVREASGIEHRLWAVSDARVLGELSTALSTSVAYIADGHHRYETALHYASELAGGSQPASDRAASQYALTYFVDSADPGLVVLGTHRLMDASVCGDLTPDGVRETLAPWFEIRDAGGAPSSIVEALDRQPGRPAFGVWSPRLGISWVVRLAHDELPSDLAQGRSAAWRRLDLAALHALGIDRLFARGTSALSEEGLLTYTRDVTEVEDAASEGRCGLAFLVRGTPAEQVMAVADAGDLMPEKSTYFFPKPPSGLVIASLTGEVGLPK